MNIKQAREAAARPPSKLSVVKDDVNDLLENSVPSEF